MADGDIVRKITISATGENIDATKASTEKLSAAISQLADANQKNTNTLRDAINNHDSYADKVLKVGTALAVVYGTIQLVTGAFSALNSMLTVHTALMTDVAGIQTTAATAASNFAARLTSDGIRAYGTSWARTNEILASYIDLAGKAAALGVSTDFYQSQIKAADNLKIANDSIIKQMETLKSATAENLGGSTGQNRVNALSGFGNFQGNTGVGELSGATSTEEKYKAVVDLINQAMAAGERLAALDVAKTFLGPDAAKNLAADSDYLNKMQTAAAKVSSQDLIATADISRAQDLADRLQAAEDTISKKWFPTQKDGLNPLVMYFKEMWVGIVELVAGAFSWVEKIVKSLLSIPGDLWQKLKDVRYGGDMQGPQQETPAEAMARLSAGLKSKSTVSAAGSESLAVSDIARPDLSSSAAKATSSYTTTTEELKKYVEQTNLAVASVGQTASETERLKAVSQIYTAGLADGLSPALAKASADMNIFVEFAMLAADQIDRATKLKAAQDAYTSAADGVKAYIEQTKLEIQYHGQSAGALKQAEVNAQLYSLALKEGMTPEAAKASVAASGLGKAAGDLATKLEALNKTPEAKDAYDRATESILKYIETTKAASDTVTLGAAAQEKARAVAQLTAAGLKDGLTPAAAAAKAEMSGLGVSAGVAAEALAKAKVASEISRGSQTAFLGPEDIAIANQLKGIYGDNIPAALASSQAAALRMNNVLKSINDTARSAVTSFGTDLVHGLEAGNTLLQSMETAAKNLATKVLDTAVSGLLTAGMNAIVGTATNPQVVGATSAATILTTAGTSLAAAMVTGATTAAGILTGGGATAGEAVGTGGTVAGGEIVTAGAATDAGLVEAGAATGTMINGPLVLLMAAIAAAAAVIGLGSNNNAAQKAANDAVMAQVAQTNSSAYDRRLKNVQDESAAQLSISSDPNSLMGQLQVFDQGAANQRLAEARAGNGAIVELENSLALQREAIIKKSNEAIAKTMNDFLNSIKTGSQSILSPQDQLAYEQNLFNTQLAGAQGGNSDDLNALTTTASALLTLAQNFYASGTGYADTYNKVTSAITGLAAHPTQTIYNDPGITGITSDVTANINSSGGNYTAAGVGYADGGYVGNGIQGIDSVMAKYAGGGNISLAGGEHVTRASSVNSNTRTSLDYINRTGKTPSSDNSEVVRVLTQGFNGQTNAIVNAISEMSARIASLESTTRQTSNQRRVPGTQKAA